MADQNKNSKTIHIYCKKCNALLYTITQDNAAEWVLETYKCKNCVRVVRLKMGQNKDILQNMPDKTYYI